MKKFRIGAAVIMGSLLLTMPCQGAVSTPSAAKKNDFAIPKLTGEWITDLYNIAWSQEGYREDDYGNTKYSDWAGQHGRAWCSEFVSWCADQANIPKTVIPVGTSSNKFRKFYSGKGRYYLLDNGMEHDACGCGAAASGTLELDELRKGDILLIESNGNFDNGPDHTELFDYVSDGRIYTIGGNVNDSVRRNWQWPDEIHGICRPNYDQSGINSSGGSGSFSSSSSSSGGGGGGGSSRSSRRRSSSTGASGGTVLGGPGSVGTLPDYVVTGTWNIDSAGRWSFVSSSGEQYRNKWAAVYNPYANTALGQQPYDWFRFDENGIMVVGWFADPLDGRIYYLNPVSDNTKGRMLTGWQTIAGREYYFNPNSDGTRGRLLMNERTGDGHFVGADGVKVY